MIKTLHTPHPRGQSLVELALSLTAILMLLSGAVDFGMAFFSYVALRDAAQEGAIYASINGRADGILDSDSLTKIRTRVRKASSGPVKLSTLSDSQITVELTNGPGTFCVPPPGNPPNGIRITVAYDYPLIMPLLGAVLGTQTIPLRATVTDTMLSPSCP